MNDDGCNSECLIEPKFTCTGGSLNTKDTWKAICGDGYRVGSEIWDDANKIKGDGCNSSCVIEAKFACKGGSSTTKDVWSPIWGDGYRIGSELWDDDNTINGDGWSAINVIFRLVWIQHGPFSLIFSSTGPAKSICTLNPMPASSSISLILTWKFYSVMIP